MSAFEKARATALKRIAQELAREHDKRAREKRKRGPLGEDEIADNLDWTPEAAERAGRLACACVSGAFDFAPETLYRPTRGGALESEARQWAAWLLRKSARMSSRLVGAVLGRDRTTIDHAVEKIEEEFLSDENAEAVLAKVSAAFAILLEVNQLLPPLLAEHAANARRAA